MKKIISIIGLLLAPLFVGAQTPTSLNPVDQWKSTTTPVFGITQRTLGKNIILTGLSGSGLLQVDANGLVSVDGQPGIGFSTTSAAYWLTKKSTTDLAEGTNLYYTLQRWASAFAGTTTDALAEGGTNKYYTDARVDSRLNTYDKGYFYSTTSADYWKTERNFFSTTSAIYFADASTTIPKTYSNNTFTGTNAFTKVLNLSGWTSSSNGTTTSLAITGLSGMVKANGSISPLSVAVADTDYQVPLTFGDGLTRTVNDIDCDTASGSVFGCLSSTDWTTFNNKVSSQWTTLGSNIYYNTGNVGIGIADPGYALAVLGKTSDATPVLNLRGYTTGTDGARTVPIRFTSSDNNNWAKAEYDAYSHHFFGNGTEKMTILSGGNVGIGTTNPGTPLSVIGTGVTALFAPGTDSIFATSSLQIRNSGTSDGSTNSIIIGADGAYTAGQAFINTTQVGFGNVTPLSFRISDVEKMRIDTTGNVGIGVDSPGAKLQITKPSGTSGTHATTPGLTIQDGGYSDGYAFQAQDSVGGQLVTITDTGDFGIGTTTPVAYLETLGSVAKPSAKFGSLELQSYSIGNAWLSDNIYNSSSGSNFKYRADGYGTMAYFNSGAFTVYTAPSGSAGATPTLTSRFSVSNVGLLTASAGIGAESGNDNYLCIDPTTYEITNGGANCGASSERYKENIKALTYGLKDILKMNPVSFDFKESKNKGLGFIAESMVKIIPEVVEMKDGKPESIDYDKLTAVLVEAIQELNRKNNALENRVKALEKMLK